MTEVKFFICKHCGNLVGMIHNSGVPMICCGEKMAQLVPNTVDASTEKHVPVITRDGNKVTVRIGAAPHPMTAEHSIQWIYLHTANGGQRRSLQAGDAPEATFCVREGEPVSAYAYCNLHGLWKTVL